MSEQEISDTDNDTQSELAAWELLREARRERDEVRDDLAEETKFHHRTHSELVQVQCQLQDVIRELDEARQSAEAFSALALKLEGERNEAREEAARLDGAYENATNYYARMIELIDERDEAREELLAVKKLYADKCKEFCDLVFESRKAKQDAEYWEELYRTVSTEAFLRTLGKRKEEAK